MTLTPTLPDPNPSPSSDQAIKMLINEQCGDGIMSAIDFYMTVGGTVGKMGEKRVVITFNGKFLPFIEQVAADNSAASPEIAE